MSTVEIPRPTPTLAEQATVKEETRRSAGQVRAFFQKTTGMIGLGIILLLIATATFAPLIATHDPVEQTLASSFDAPSWAGGSGGHVLGADNLGRDIFSRLVYGSRISLMVGFVAASVSAVLGTTLGLIAGWKGGIVNTLVLRFADVQFALPFLVVCLALVAVYGPGIEKVVILLSLWGWAIYARTISVSVERVKRLDYVSAARLAGARTNRLVIRHVLPNVWGPAIVLWSAAAGGLIMAESGLSLLGLGVQAPQFSWGSMLASGPAYMRTAWWMTLFPALALLLVTIGFNLLGDALRDVVNPKLANEDTAPQLD